MEILFLAITVYVKLVLSSSSTRIIKHLGNGHALVHISQSVPIEHMTWPNETANQTYAVRWVKAARAYAGFIDYFACEQQ